MPETLSALESTSTSAHESASAAEPRPGAIAPEPYSCRFRKLNNGTPSQKRFWKGVVPFTPGPQTGVNDKIGLWGPKLRFKFRRCPVGAVQEEDGPGVTLNCGLSFGKGPNAFWAGQPYALRAA